MILINVLRLLAFLAAMALDVTAFFLIVRLVMDFWSPDWLDAFDKAGEKVVKKCTSSMNRLLARCAQTPLSLRQQLLVSLVIISAARLFICLMLKAF